MVRERFKLLIIEDSAEDVNVMRTYLCGNEDCDYDFTWVDTGKKALAEFRKREYDAILLDYHLPDIDGIKLLEEFAKKSGPELPVVMITGQGDERLAVRALKQGAADYIVKSTLTAESLFRATHNAIEKHRSNLRARALEREKEKAVARELEALRDLRHEKRRLQAFFEQIPAPVGLLRASALAFEFLNQPMRELVKDLGVEVNHLLTLREAFGPDLHHIAKLVYTSGKRFQANEFELATGAHAKDPLYFNLTFEPQLGEKKETDGVILMMADVTAHVNARHLIEESEVRARESEERFRKIAEIIPHMIWVADETGSVIYLNQAWYEFTGSSFKDNEGEKWLRYLHPEDRERVVEIWREALREGRSYEAMYRMLRASDHQYRWHIARAMPLRNESGRIEKWYGSNADIHDQRALTEDLRFSEQRLLLATQASRVGIWECDQDGRNFWRNSEFDRSMGLSAGLVRHVQEALEHVLPEDRGTLERLLLHALEVGESFDFEFRVITAEQSLRWIHIRGAMDRGTVAKPRMSGTVLDITERKNREQDLQDAKNTAEAANLTKSAFLANMSHEIRTPLNAIIGFTDIIAAGSLSEPQRIKYAETVQRNGRALMQIIDDILDLSKIEAGKLDLEMCGASLMGIVDDLSLMYAPLAQAKGLEFDVSLEDNLPANIYTDPIRLRQVLMNALSNAIKFTSQGQVSLRVGRSGGSKGSQAWLTFSILDTGIGISEEQQSRLFQAFTQADVSMTRKFGGTGLGLMLSRRLAKLLGGAYYLAKSRPGQGSTFELRVPAESSLVDHLAARPASAANGVSQHRLQGVRLLVVDDSADSRLISRLYLERQGAIVDDVESAAEAQEALNSAEYEALITDIQMPEMDGLELARRLRSEGFAKPVIGLSAHVFREDRQRSREAGIDRHVSKPVKSIDLVDAIVAELVRYREGRARLNDATAD